MNFRPTRFQFKISSIDYSNLHIAQLSDSDDSAHLSYLSKLWPPSQILVKSLPVCPCSWRHIQKCIHHPASFASLRQTSLGVGAAHRFSPSAHARMRWSALWVLGGLFVQHPPTPGEARWPRVKRFQLLVVCIHLLISADYTSDICCYVT